MQYYHCPELANVDAIATERKYTNRDEVWVSPQNFGEEYDKKLGIFFAEHIHEDEEIRYITGGSGFFDVRDQGDEWIRIHLQKDDMIILPAGIYHRFTTDVNNVSFMLNVYTILTLPIRGTNWPNWLQDIRAMRLFQTEPKWVPLNRGTPDCDQNKYRMEYLSKLGLAEPANDRQ